MARTKKRRSGRRRSRRAVQRRTPRRRARRVRRLKRITLAVNPSRRRRRSSRRYRRNPPAFGSIGTSMLYAGVGFAGTRLVGNVVLPMVPGMENPMLKLVAKAGVAYGVAWAGERFMRLPFTPLFLGGAMEVVQELIKLYVAPLVPQLGDVGIYAGLGAYPTPSNGALPTSGPIYPYIPEMQGSESYEVS